MVLPKPESGASSSRAETELLQSVAARALAGDAAALQRLLLTLSPDMARVARYVLGSTAPELDDVVQEALLSLVRALPSFRGECSLRRFGNRIAVRMALHARRRSRKRCVDAELLGLEPASAAQAARDPELDYLAARRSALLRQLIDELPEAQAETLALRILLGCSLEETAEATGVPVNTVRSRLRLSREAMRARIERDPVLLDLLGGQS